MLEGGTESVDVDLEGVSSNSSEFSFFADFYACHRSAPGKPVKMREDLERPYSKAWCPLTKVRSFILISSPLQFPHMTSIFCFLIASQSALDQRHNFEHFCLLTSILSNSIPPFTMLEVARVLVSPSRSHTH